MASKYPAHVMVSSASPNPEMVPLSGRKVTGNGLAGRTATPDSSSKDVLHRHQQKVKNHGAPGWEGRSGAAEDWAECPEQNLQKERLCCTSWTGDKSSWVPHTAELGQATNSPASRSVPAEPAPGGQLVGPQESHVSVVTAGNSC